MYQKSKEVTESFFVRGAVMMACKRQVLVRVAVVIGCGFAGRMRVMMVMRNDAMAKQDHLGGEQQSKHYIFPHH